ncbi:MAG: methyltransferase domain-containing protein [Alphaproteobacteria bacterium]|nr:methyltransferase domain-containing protein [Alphaproteobacteria bacterium]
MGWKLEVIVPASAVDPFAEAVGSLCEAVVSFEIPQSQLWRIEGYASDMPAHAESAAAMAIAAARAGIPEPEFTCVPLPIVDWVTENQRSFQPLHAGRYFIRPSHHEGPAPHGAIALTLDAGAAFGTGEHATTKSCLLALDWLARRRRFACPLDLGCGSGILALAVAATWRCKVVASDIDPQAVAVARENAFGNGLAAYTIMRRGDGLSDRTILRSAPYDLITANILARPLVAMSRPLSHCLMPGGVTILSGLLADQENGVRNAYRRQGLALVRRFAVDGWHTLVMARNTKER